MSDHGISSELHELVTQVAVLSEKTSTIAHNVEEIKKSLEKDYTPLSRFKPVERITYLLLGLVVAGFFGFLAAS